MYCCRALDKRCYRCLHGFLKYLAATGDHFTAAALVSDIQQVAAVRGHPSTISPSSCSPSASSLSSATVVLCECSTPPLLTPVSSALLLLAIVGHALTRLVAFSLDLLPVTKQDEELEDDKIYYARIATPRGASPTRQQHRHDGEDGGFCVVRVCTSCGGGFYVYTLETTFRTYSRSANEFLGSKLLEKNKLLLSGFRLWPFLNSPKAFLHHFLSTLLASREGAGRRMRALARIVEAAQVRAWLPGSHYWHASEELLELAYSEGKQKTSNVATQLVADSKTGASFTTTTTTSLTRTTSRCMVQCLTSRSRSWTYSGAPLEAMEILGQLLLLRHRPLVPSSTTTGYEQVSLHTSNDNTSNDNSGSCSTANANINTDTTTSGTTSMSVSTQPKTIINTRTTCLFTRTTINKLSIISSSCCSSSISSSYMAQEVRCWVERALCALFPGCHVILFGSEVSGFAVPGSSDVDVCCVVPPREPREGSSSGVAEQMQEEGEATAEELRAEVSRKFGPLHISADPVENRHRSALCVHLSHILLEERLENKRPKEREGELVWLDDPVYPSVAPPLIRFHYRAKSNRGGQNIKVELSFNNVLGILNSQMLRKYVLFGNRLGRRSCEEEKEKDTLQETMNGGVKNINRQGGHAPCHPNPESSLVKLLGLLVKQWASARRVRDASLNSYCLTLLVVFFLQHTQIRPCHAREGFEIRYFTKDCLQEEDEGTRNEEENGKGHWYFILPNLQYPYITKSIYKRILSTHAGECTTHVSPSTSSPLTSTSRSMLGSNHSHPPSSPKPCCPALLNRRRSSPSTMPFAQWSCSSLFLPVGGGNYVWLLRPVELVQGLHDVWHFDPFVEGSGGPRSAALEKQCAVPRRRPWLFTHVSSSQLRSAVAQRGARPREESAGRTSSWDKEEQAGDLEEKTEKCLIDISNSDSCPSSSSDDEEEEDGWWRKRKKKRVIKRSRRNKQQVDRTTSGPKCAPPVDQGSPLVGAGTPPPVVQFYPVDTVAAAPRIFQFPVPPPLHHQRYNRSSEDKLGGEAEQGDYSNGVEEGLQDEDNRTVVDVVNFIFDELLEDIFCSGLEYIHCKHKSALLACLFFHFFHFYAFHFSHLRNLISLRFAPFPLTKLAYQHRVVQESAAVPMFAHDVLHPYPRILSQAAAGEGIQWVVAARGWVAAREDRIDDDERGDVKKKTTEARGIDEKYSGNMLAVAASSSGFAESPCRETFPTGGGGGGSSQARTKCKLRFGCLEVEDPFEEGRLFRPKNWARQRRLEKEMKRSVFVLGAALRAAERTRWKKKRPDGVNALDDVNEENRPPVWFLKSLLSKKNISDEEEDESFISNMMLLKSVRTSDDPVAASSCPFWTAEVQPVQFPQPPFGPYSFQEVNDLFRLVQIFQGK